MPTSPLDPSDRSGPRYASTPAPDAPRNHTAVRLGPGRTIACLGSLVAAALVVSCGQTTEFRETVSTKVLMTSVLEPAADGVWDAVGTIMTVEGTEEIEPSTPEEWLAVRNAAITVAESANLLLTPRRFVDHDHWTGWSLDLADAGRAAMVAAETQDVDALFEAGGLIYEACTGCHGEYWPNDPSRQFQFETRPQFED